MTRIAYFISAYKEPQRVARLVNRLETGSDSVFIHFDKAIGGRIFKNWKRFIELKCLNKNVEIVSEFRCKWGSFGLVDATLSAMRYFEEINYDYFINLSGECYPLKPPEVIKEELDGQSCGFMRVFKLPYQGWWHGGMNRIQKRYYFIPTSKPPFVKALGLPRLWKRLPCNLQPYGGSDWFCLPKQHVSYVIRFLNKNPPVQAFFKSTLDPDEMFFQTILMNSPFQSRIVNDDKRYVDWSPPATAGHPRILTKDDFDKMKKSGKLFARKFNLDVDKDILDVIDQEIEEFKRHRATVPN